MTTDGENTGGDAPARAFDKGCSEVARPYEAPRIIVLGSLADLTAGGTADEPDGHVGAGLSGSI